MRWAATIIVLLRVSNGMRLPTDRYDWAVLYMCLATLGCSLPFGFMELWLSPNWLLEMLFFPVGAAAVVFTVVAVVKRHQPLRAILYLLATILICCITLSPRMAVAAETKYFECNRNRYEKACAATMNGDGRIRVLPSHLKDLTYDGKDRYWKDMETDKVFIVFPKSFDGIDNGFGYMWSNTDAWPDQLPFFALYGVERISSNWFYFRYS